MRLWDYMSEYYWFMLITVIGVCSNERNDEYCIWYKMLLVIKSNIAWLIESLKKCNHLKRHFKSEYFIK